MNSQRTYQQIIFGKIADYSRLIIAISVITRYIGLLTSTLLKQCPFISQSSLLFACLYFKFFFEGDLMAAIIAFYNYCNRFRTAPGCLNLEDKNSFLKRSCELLRGHSLQTFQICFYKTFVRFGHVQLRPAGGMDEGSVYS